MYKGHVDKAKGGGCGGESSGNEMETTIKKKKETEREKRICVLFQSDKNPRIN